MRWLLIGNSRWHWAERCGDDELRGWDGFASSQPLDPPVAWAAVGHRPAPGSCCPPEREVRLGDVPLQGCPPWLGVDRALAGWGAWRQERDSVLVVDAGTVLSMTRVDANGTFQGGRLLAGLRLQLEAMASRTTLIPQVLSQPEGAPGQWSPLRPDPAWPHPTAAAMQVGVEGALAAAVIAGAQEAGCSRVVLTGGDGAALLHPVASGLKALGLAVLHKPLLCLESLATLRPQHQP